ncbi:unnamed protein product [Caenorhabditis bovis]|uniref:Battenin n=1 Tax=Caenorhabditis bovis TaxID=2654633 RepID=A0A8S1EW17_9PELO|nr:unnamed protein product [Caenorhabditis bovis]
MVRADHTRNFFSFWVFGLCNNFAYVMMLSAAQDILTKNENQTATKDDEHVDHCLNSTSTRFCNEMSTGIVLICNILPCFVIKILSPLFIHRIPYGVRVYFQIILIVISLFIIAFSNNVAIALFGVTITSFASGLGENSFLALASHFPQYSIGAWCSGTGAAGVTGSFAYAVMTDPRLLDFSPKTTMLVSNIVPLMFAFTYWKILVHPDTVQKVSMSKPKSWISLRNENDGDENSNGDHSMKEKISIMKSLLKYTIPIAFVYFAEYFINQGLVELSVFDCDSGFGTSPKSQYRWYQVLYQIGVFISRSSNQLIQLSLGIIVILPILQMANVFVFLVNALHPFLGNFAIACGFVFFEGLIGGASYVNSFAHIHKNVDESVREFALGTCSLADSLGIVIAAFTAIPVHNAICKSAYL